MASFLHSSASSFSVVTAFIFCCFFLFSSAANAEDGFNFGPEKKTHLHFFFHDVVSGPNPSAIRVAAAPTTNSSPTGFGAVVVLDNALTEGPDPHSRLIGRAQGMYTLASNDELAMLMAMNYHFLESEYNGSTLAILGRNSALTERRDMSVVGGSGYFRLARGYAVAKTYSRDAATGDAIVQYDVYVVH